VSLIKHLSYIQLNTYLRCPQQYYYRYIEGKIYPPKARLCQGQAFHSTQEDGFSKKLGYRKGYKTSDLKILFAEYFDDQMRTQDPVFEEDDTHGKLLDQGVEAVAVYGREKACRIWPKQVEMPFEITFSNAAITFKGRIDLIDVRNRLLDMKLRRRRFSENDLKTDMQMTSYFVGFREIFGFDPSYLGFDVTLLQKEVKFERVPVVRDGRNVRNFLDTVAGISKAIQSGIFYPNTTGYLCSPDWCGYWNICQEKRRD
jgi:CRISPR/Cas system-associated exonuclease Cas4 (RecB family)